MHRLSLCRHAKSSWNNAGQSDFDRPLNERGLRDAPLMAARVAALREKPNEIISSPANRALTTAQHYAEALRFDDSQINVEPRIYEASTESLIQLVCEFTDDTRHLMLVGHNPGFSDLACWLASCPFRDMPTGAVAVIELNIAHWSEVHAGCGSLRHYLFPKDGED